MASQTANQITTRTYIEDTVTLATDPDKLGVVTKTWHDVEDESAVPEDPDASNVNDGLSPLPRGYVLVSFLDNSPPQLIHQNNLNIVDRSLHLGDVVKRRPEDMMSGIVSGGEMRLSLEHTFTGQVLHNVDSQHVRSAFDFNEGQYVLFQNRWVAQIDEVLQSVIVRLSNNTLVLVEKPQDLDLATPEGKPIVDHSLFLSDKFVVGQHVVTKKSNLRRGRWILGEYDPYIEPHGVVVDARAKLLTVAWVAQRYCPSGNSPMTPFLEPNFSVLQPDEDPIIVLSNLSDPTSYQIGDRVRFCDREVETGQYGAQRMDRRHLAGFDGNVWLVTGVHTIVDVDWQDGTTSQNLWAKDLRMYLNVDEYEGWPGESVSQERPEGGARFGIIQSVLPEQRLSRVRFYDEGVLLPEVEEISLYDLNSHPILQYGLGDHVLIRSKLAPLPGLVEEVVNIASEFVEGLVRSVTDSEDTSTLHQRATTPPSETIDWMGEVVKINGDGTVKVRLAREADPPPTWAGENFVIVKAEDLIVFEDDDETESVVDAEGWIDDDEGDVWHDGVDSDDEWEDASQGNMDIDIPEASLDGIDDEPVSEQVVTNGETEEPSPLVEVPHMLSDANEWGINREKCAPFDILEVIPDDHPFKSDNVNSTRRREWLARVRKEHKILQTSLPDGILVRTYESRLDLLRVLILGPKNTPYENAPFLFDFSLSDNFPNEPPEAFFHSWTPGGSNGRINPNLYVEGRVCLSLLGTWHSHNDTESWNPKQSTLLQLFLSIQSLVLVARPYYNEAGFATHVGLDDASVNERLYSERAYLLSRGFVKYALENAVEGLETEIGYLYVDEDGPQLANHVIEDGKRVISQSEIEGPDDGEWAKGSVTRLSQGGLQVLRRTVDRLEDCLGKYRGRCVVES